MLVVDHLFRPAQHRPFVARLIYEEFWRDRAGYSAEHFERRLAEAGAAGRIPLSFLALEDGRPVGTINLVDNDDEARTHLRPWLAALAVVADRRRSGVGRALVGRLLDEAAALGFREVYLGTDAPAYYARFGATPLERATGALVVMRCPTRVLPGRSGPPR